MKNRIYIPAFLLISGILTSCEGKMDFDPYAQTPQQEFWQTEDDATSAVVACYGKLCDWPFFEPTTFALEEMASGNTAKGSTPDDQPDLDKIVNFQFTPSMTIFDTFWKSRYGVINVCNQAITNIGNMSIDETKKASLIGEARFIRAWIYFELVRTFGEVVVYDGLPANNDYNIAKSSIPEVYSFIEKDLEYGIKNLPLAAWSADMKGRVTSWAAKALLAKVKMYEASGANFMEDGQTINGTTWQDVKDLTDDVIAHGIYSLYDKDGEASFFNLFRIENENCNESILEAQCGASKLAGGVNRSAYAVYQWVRGGSFAGWGFNVPTDQLIADWETRTDDGIRYKASIAYRGEVLPDGRTINGTETLSGTKAGTAGYKPARYNFKVYVPEDDETGLGGWMTSIEQNPRLFRYADVLLIDAEAEFNLSNIGEAVKSINKVRNRAYATPYTEENLTKQLIWDERRFELAFENDRFFDLVRTGQAKTALASQGFVSPKNNFYPIPQNQIDLSYGVLIQNKNY